MTSSRIDSDSVFDAPGSQPGLRQRMKSEARRVSSQHRKLEAFFETVDSALRSDSQGEAMVAYQRLSDALESHFSLEDEVYFPALNGLDPLHGKALSGLAREHGLFRQNLSELHAQLATGSLEPFATSFERFAARIEAHELREEELLAQISGAPA